MDAFLDIVEVELSRLIEENNDLARPRWRRGRPSRCRPREPQIAAELAATREENARLQAHIAELSAP